ncbi:MAG: CTP synthase ura7 [Vezdaea aestivalis]|nr:MAG: CTP synthase ura7 [Vezdaea aestivalis]
MKYVLVSGGVMSGIGKGVIDPYINVDAGTMAPTEHGEVFVLNDGGEVDLDLGNYERYLNIALTRDNNITTGKIFQHVIERERKGDYLGKTVQMVPHVTGAMQEWVERVARIPVDSTNETPDICIIELGGTVGDIESAPFIEAMTQLRRSAGKDNFLHIQVSLVPVNGGEQKTRPTQQAVRSVLSAGLSPDMIFCRCVEPLIKSTIAKIADFCFIEHSNVVSVHDVPNTYSVPPLLEDQGIISIFTKQLDLSSIEISPALYRTGQMNWKQWKDLVDLQKKLSQTVKIALVGKYTSLKDSYLSVIKALEHASMRCSRELNILWVDSEHLEDKHQSVDRPTFDKAWLDVTSADGILIPGGFGERGTEGMIKAAEYARTEHVPFLGICLGMQIAVIEMARNVCGFPHASSVELFSHCPDPVIIFMPEISITHLGGTMRLGLRPTVFQPGLGWSKLRKLYKGNTINERHRHRYEVNPTYVDRLMDRGCKFIGRDDKGERMEILELEDHPWYVGVQFHPEYLSRVLDPSKPYLGFVAASAKCLDQITEELNSKPVLNGEDERVLTNGVKGLEI